MKKIRFLTLVSAMLISFNVFAGAKAPPSQSAQFWQKTGHADEAREPIGQYSKYLLENRTEALRRSADNVIAASKRTEAEFKQASDDYLNRVKNANELLGESDGAQETLLKAKTPWERQARLGDLETEEAAGTLTADQKTELKALRKERKERLSGVSKAAGTAETLKAQYAEGVQDVRTVKQKIDKRAGELNADVVACAQSLESSADKMNECVKGLLKTQQWASLQEMTNSLFEDVKDDYMKSGLLAADLGYLRDKMKYDDNLLKAVKLASSKRLDNTMLGQYMKEQVKKVFDQICELQAKCSNQRTTDDLKKSINQILNYQDFESGDGKPASPANAAPAKQPE